MPARKSDARKSDVSQREDTSNARFALKDDFAEPQPSAGVPTSSAAPQPDPAAPPKPSSSTSPPLAKMSHHKPSQPPSQAQQGSESQATQQGGDETEDEQPSIKHHEASAVSIEDLTLPKSIITRLAKGVLPANTQIQANAVLAMSKSTTVFVNYLASNANDHTMSMGKKTISPADVFKALDDVEFGFLKERLEAEYNKFNQIQTEKRTSYRAKVKAAKTGGPNDPQTDGNSQPPDADVSMADSATPGDTSLADDAHRAKKARVDPDATVDTVEQDDAETEDDEAQQDEEEQDDEVEEEDDEEDEGSDEEEAREQHDEGIEDRVRGDERDEALDGDDSD